MPAPKKAMGRGTATTGNKVISMHSKNSLPIGMELKVMLDMLGDLRAKREERKAVEMKERIAAQEECKFCLEAMKAIADTY